jgi:hypothetical protein
MVKVSQNFGLLSQVLNCFRRAFPGVYGSLPDIKDFVNTSIASLS